ncbi:MAG: hypothetical protein J0L84_13010 [Verrucomicrobia bacterium]|nr:hypothetical protein [Verrucomicrobiota bacterium]
MTSLGWRNNVRVVMSTPRPRRFRRLALATLLGLAGLVVMVVLFNRPGDTQDRIARLRAAGYPTTPAELDAWYVHPPDQENLATPLIETMADFQFDKNDTNLPVLGKFRAEPADSPWPPHALNAAREFLTKNSNALVRLHAALERPKYRFPGNLAQMKSAVLTRSADTVRNAGSSLALEARVVAEENRLDQAVKALLLAQHLADRVEAEPDALPYLVAEAIRRINLNAAESILSQHELSPTNLLRLQERLLASAATTSPERAIAGTLVEFLHITGQRPRGLDAWYGRTKGTALSVYWTLGLHHRDRRLGTRLYDEWLAALRLPSDQRVAAAREINDSLGKQLSRGLHPVASTTLPIGWTISEKHASDLTRLRAGATACAIERFRQREGSLPESLEALVPVFMASIPTDAFTGRPLSYRRLDRGFVVYGVGEDGADNGGLPRERRPKAGDRSFDDTFTVTR